ncbi:MAG TPA: UbiA family prenyltransferase [Nanoarchaeota archaeon]|nr:UbiA family prenyltransferase [Nanoarchaeota archaeon]
MNKYIELLRIRQWYKNVVVFLPIVFVGRLFNAPELVLTLLGFFALCLASSSSYIINDIIDREADRKNPEKRMRPLASGTIGVPSAAVAAALILAAALVLSWAISMLFAAFVLALFALTFLYSIWLKNEVFADVLVIAVNFVIRAVSGVFIISATISPWLILCTFFLSLFLSAGKRFSELSFLAEKAKTHRKVLGAYSPSITSALLIISTSLLVMSYSLYSFISIYPYLIFTLPLALYLAFRYLYLIYTGSEIARHTERAYKDKGLMAGLALLLAAVFILIYA